MSELRKIKSLWYTDRPKWKDAFQKLRSTCKHEKTRFSSLDSEPAGITIKCLLCGKNIQITELPSALKEKIKNYFDVQTKWQKSVKTFYDGVQEPLEIKELQKK